MGLDRSNMPPTCNIMDHTSTNIALVKDSGSQPTNNVSSFFNNNNNSQMQPVPVKCVLLGDGAVGKTSMIVSYTTNGYPSEYMPTVIDNFSVIVKVDGRSVQLQLCDTAGQDDFDELRPLCYPSTDVFILCFSVVSPTSFHNILEKWVPEVRTHGKKASVILVGTQCDLRNDVKIIIELARYKEKPVSESDAKALADQIGALAYIECSALTQKNLKDVFDLALMASLDLTQDIKLLKRSKKYKGDIPERLSRASINSAATPTPRQSQCQSRTSQDLTVTKKKGWKRFCCFLS